MTRFADEIAAIAAAEIDRWPAEKPIALHPRMDAIVLEGKSDRDFRRAR